MGLSNYLPTSAIAKPGVCTSSTRPASPYDGQVIYETDTDKTLVWNGSAWVLLSTGTANPPGLEHIKTQTTTSGTSVVVDSVFSSTYDSYRIVVSDMRAASAATGVNMKMRNTSGSNSSNYYYGGLYLSAYGNTTVNATTSGPTSSWDLNTVMGTGAGGFALDIFNPFLSQTTSITMNGLDPRTSGGPRIGLSGFHNDTTSYAGFEFVLTQSISNFVTRVYGYRN